MLWWIWVFVVVVVVPFVIARLVPIHTLKSWAISQIRHWKGSFDNNEFHKEPQFPAWNNGVSSHHWLCSRFTSRIEILGIKGKKEMMKKNSLEHHMKCCGGYEYGWLWWWQWHPLSSLSWWLWLWHGRCPECK